eukprot:gnl/TRDRNA2_/TRDRNA2_135948_c0_seq2.p1 gnl/TRDRNA2_/TRDRNA2_135948_c0~~gnl/TRDRNA2_/TRDRNA2_135948_c0_seq2.p1  ORF type:complete len:113 (-),score=22.80 gnl/TRDRNA2_/TRDRNA2_135948_c0_seq2:5-343(-)
MYSKVSHLLVALFLGVHQPRSGHAVRVIRGTTDWAAQHRVLKVEEAAMLQTQLDYVESSSLRQRLELAGLENVSFYGDMWSTPEKATTDDMWSYGVKLFSDAKKNILDKFQS